jgi:hypothetical protein
MKPGARIARLVPGSHLPALVVTLIIAVVAALFAGSYSLAMADPKPYDVPIGLVSSVVTPAELRTALSEPPTPTGDGYLVAAASESSMAAMRRAVDAACGMRSI